MTWIHEWWESPGLSYSRGLSDGYALGYDAALADLLDNVFQGHLMADATRTITATPAPSATQPTTPDQTRSWPTGHPDWPGYLHMTPEQRRAAIRHLRDSWETDNATHRT